MQNLLGETAAIAQDELKKKQAAIDDLHGSLRIASVQLAETRRKVEAAKEKVKQQQHDRQKITNLSHELEHMQYRLGSIEQEHGASQSKSAAAWEDELDAVIESLESGGATKPSALPDINLLRARVKATNDVLAAMRAKVGAVKSSSRDLELRYRRLVALAASCPEGQVDDLLEGLLRAVQSEKGELEIGRVRKFLGGVDGV